MLTTEEIQELRAATRARIGTLLERRKKVRGNLCVLTGKGSGGGFVPCNSGTFGRTDAGTLQGKRAKTALALRKNIQELRKALVEGNVEKTREHARALMAMDRAGRIMVVPGSATMSIALLARTSPEMLERIVKSYKALAEKKARDDARPAFVHNNILPDPTKIPKKIGNTDAPHKATGPNNVTLMMRKVLKDKKLAKGWESLKEMEDRIASGRHETAGIYDDTMSQILTKKGKAHSVSFNMQERQFMKDAVLTHNHPNALGLSGADMRMAIANDLAQIRAVANVYSPVDGKKVGRITYTFTRPEGGWTGPTGMSLKGKSVAMVDSYRKADTEFRSKYKEMVKQRGWGNLQTSIAGVIAQNMRAAEGAGLGKSYGVKIEGDFMTAINKRVVGAEEAPKARSTRKVNPKTAAKKAETRSLVDRAWKVYKGSVGSEQRNKYLTQQSAEGMTGPTRAKIGKTEFVVNPTRTSSKESGIAYWMRSTKSRSGGYALIRHPDRPDMLMVVNTRDVHKSTKFDGKFFKVVNGELMEA